MGVTVPSALFPPATQTCMCTPVETQVSYVHVFSIPALPAALGPMGAPQGDM